MANRLHVSKWGTYHPDPGSEIAWTVNDTRGSSDTGPSCNECGDCECLDCECGSKERACLCENEECEKDRETGETYCIGLSFAYHCLDGGECYCQDCFDKLDDRPEIVPCDCK